MSPPRPVVVFLTEADVRLTREADYAVRVVLDLVEHAGGRPVRTSEVARRQFVPRPFLTKIVQRLARAGYVRTHRGNRGGLTLASDPRTLTLRHIVEAIEGPIALNQCLVRRGACPLVGRCPVNPIWQRIQEFMILELEGATIESLRRQGAARKTTRGGR